MSFNNKKKIQKFKVTGKVWVISLILTIVAIGFFVYTTICLNTESKPNVLISTVKDISVIVMSILGTNLLVSVFVEVYNKNKILNDFFNKDIISASQYYTNLVPEQRCKMLKALEFSERCNNNIVMREMYESIQKKISEYKKDDYYFEELEYSVTCTDKGSYYEKDVLRTMRLKSYDGTCTIENYKIAEVNVGKINGNIDTFEVSSVYVNGQPVEYKPPCCADNSDVNDCRNGYLDKITLELKEKIEFDNLTGIIITVDCITRCPKEDKVSTYRISRPCKKFTVSYTADSNYKLTGHAFGFLDSAEAYPNPKKKNTIKLGFSDWIFTDDGVIVTMIPGTTKRKKG